MQLDLIFELDLKVLELEKNYLKKSKLQISKFKEPVSINQNIFIMLKWGPEILSKGKKRPTLVLTFLTAHLDENFDGL
jgi:hypothetical protein